MAVEIIFETHSLSKDNEHDPPLATGWLDGELSPKGKELARELGNRRKADRLDAVFTSDSGRAIETAAIAFEGSGLPVYRDQRLRECNYGALNGVPASQLQRGRHVDVPFPNGESYQEVVARVQDVLKGLSNKCDGKRVVIIGHSATRWALDVLLRRKNLHELVEAPFDWQEGWYYFLP